MNVRRLVRTESRNHAKQMFESWVSMPYINLHSGCGCCQQTLMRSETNGTNVWNRMRIQKLTGICFDRNNEQRFIIVDSSITRRAMRSVKEGLSCPIPSNMTSEPK
jgi:hypothetical protein